MLDETLYYVTLFCGESGGHSYTSVYNHLIFHRADVAVRIMARYLDVM